MIVWKCYPIYLLGPSISHVNTLSVISTPPPPPTWFMDGPFNQFFNFGSIQKDNCWDLVESASLFLKQISLTSVGNFLYQVQMNKFFICCFLCFIKLPWVKSITKHPKAKKKENFVFLFTKFSKNTTAFVDGSYLKIFDFLKL